MTNEHKATIDALTTAIATKLDQCFSQDELRLEQSMEIVETIQELVEAIVDQKKHDEREGDLHDLARALIKHQERIAFKFQDAPIVMTRVVFVAGPGKSQDGIVVVLDQEPPL